MLRCDTRTQSSYVPSRDPPDEAPLLNGAAVDPALVRAGDAAGSSSCDETASRSGALTPAVLNLLLLRQEGPGTREVDEMTAELHATAREGPQAPRSVLHALSKESLDVLRAERIARRMAQHAEQQQQQQQQLDTSRSAAENSGSTTRRGAGKLKSSRNAKAADSKIFLPIVSSRASTKASASEGTRSHELDVVPELSER